MRFAIFGDHRDGWLMAEALQATGRHQVVACAGSSPPSSWPSLRITGDPEELLADPTIEAVIVASPRSQRLDHARRALQSDRPVLCVHPLDSKPDGAYEINLLQGDVHQVALPILVEPDQSPADPIDLTLPTTVEEMFEDGALATFPGWSILRRLGGDIAEISAIAAKEEIARGDSVAAHGVFQNKRLFRVNWPIVEHSAWHPDPRQFAAIAERFEYAVARLRDAPRVTPGSGPALDLRDGLSWLDEIRAAELDEAVRLGVKRRRSIVLDYQEANEVVGFKSAMTLFGCALLWLAPVVLLLSVWVPWLAWLIMPALLLFLALQFLKRRPPGPRESEPEA